MVPLALALGGVGGCAVNPATGESTFTGLMSHEDEVRIGRQEHPKIVKAFGGEYGSPDLRRYVDSIGQLLVRTAERRDLKFTFTVLNSDIVNAFATPGGYIYISRGLMALAGNEAELAAVLGHEIGHVAALHHAQRMGQDLLANILVTGLGVVVGGPAGDLGGLVAEGVLRSYSREHEYQADDLGIRYLARAGYDPKAMSGFLTRMRADAQLQARIHNESSDKVDQFNYLATHPAPIERVQRATTNAATAQVRNPMLATDVYLKKIDGIIYGDDPEQGFVRGRSFLHPKLRFRFDVPPGFRLFNSERSVSALGPRGTRIVFDRAPQPSDGPMRNYVTDVWARGARLLNVESLTINGMPAAVATTEARTSEGVRAARLIAIRVDLQTIYRFVFLAPPAEMTRYLVDFRRTSYSFRRLTPAEAAALKPLHIRTIRAAAGDTVRSLAARQPDGEFREERLRVLNGLGPNQEIVPGQMVKVVTE
jgi:predicted Zn-dependent protease